MLVLTRKKDQTLVIGDDVEITVLDIQGDQIRLGVNAPKNVKIFRKELYLEIQEENKNAARRPAQGMPEKIGSLLNKSNADAVKNIDTANITDAIKNTDAVDSADATKNNNATSNADAPKTPTK